MYQRILLLFVTASFANKLPPFLHICHRSDPDLNQCIIHAVYEIKPHLAEGIPEMNIPSLEPLVLTNVIDDTAAGLTLKVFEVKSYGSSDFTIDYLNYDHENGITEFNLTLPFLKVDATYDISGKLLMIPLNGKGTFHANITQCKSHNFMVSERYTRNGKTYFRYINNTVHAKVKNAKVHLDSLFQGDAVINEALNEGINKNIKSFIKELLPAIEKGLQEKFLEISNIIVKDYTLDELMPE